MSAAVPHCFDWYATQPDWRPRGDALPAWLDVGFQSLPLGWVGLEVAFTLLTPWYSKDDRYNKELDNPVRRDRVFGVPFVAAASWKGMLRWACGKAGGGDAAVLHLFGNKCGAEQDFQRGALAFRPSWFDAGKVGREMINPHPRKTRAGKNPIPYEVVGAGAASVLRVLYAPLPGRAAVPSAEALGLLMMGIEALLQDYGISAKRTVGWGAARIDGWKATAGGDSTLKAKGRAEFMKNLQEALA